MQFHKSVSYKRIIHKLQTKEINLLYVQFVRSKGSTGEWNKFDKALAQKDKYTKKNKYLTRNQQKTHWQ